MLDIFHRFLKQYIHGFLHKIFREFLQEIFQGFPKKASSLLIQKYFQRFSIIFIQSFHLKMLQDVHRFSGFPDQPIPPLSRFFQILSYFHRLSPTQMMDVIFERPHSSYSTNSYTIRSKTFLQKFLSGYYPRFMCDSSSKSCWILSTVYFGLFLISDITLQHDTEFPIRKDSRSIGFITHGPQFGFAVSYGIVF